MTHARECADVRPGITITNYDRLHKFDVSARGGVVLDESSIIKHHAAKTLQTLLDARRRRRTSSCDHGDASPNDWTDSATMHNFSASDPERKCLPSSSSMTAATRRHGASRAARQVFWRWVASWVRWCARRQTWLRCQRARAAAVERISIPSRPSTTRRTAFAMEAQTLMERRDARASLVERVRAQ